MEVIVEKKGMTYGIEGRSGSNGICTNIGC